MNKNYLVKTFLNLYNNEGSYYRRPEAKILEANRKTLKEVYEKVKFFSDIVKVKNALATLPNGAKATDDAVRSAKSDIEKADNAYKAR